MNTDFGMRVTIWLGAPYNETPVRYVFRNVTEVHHNYPSLRGESSGKVAIESDIHGDGVTYELQAIVEMEIVPDTELAQHSVECDACA
jgi:hypothetical protein